MQNNLKETTNFVFISITTLCLLISCNTRNMMKETTGVTTEQALEVKPPVAKKSAKSFEYTRRYQDRQLLLDERS